MKLKHPTHDPKPMDALSYYLQVQREYALAREGYLRIDEADDTYNDLNRKIIDAYRERYGAAYLGRINYSGNQRQRIADGTESVFEAYTGQPLYNFCCDFCVSVPDRTLEELIRRWNNADIPLSEKKVDTIMDRITLPGAFFLAVVAIMPAFARIAGVSMEFSQFFGGTSLLILVGVVLDTLQQVESHLLMRHYDGLLKSGRIKGRSGAVGAY
mgnify:CR=1 FL=1